MKCLETRSRNGMRWRRYRTDAGASWATYEVPVSVIGELGTKNLKIALARAQRKLDRLNKNALALAMMAAGDKPLAVANELGICEAQARRIMQRARSGR